MASQDWPTPRLTREQRLASTVLRRFNAKPPVAVEEIARAFASLEEALIPGRCDGLIVGLHPGHSQRPRIVVEQTSASVRKRFTIAHEVGHLLLPWHSGEGMACVPHDSFRNGSAEAEANRFASELLLPCDWLDGLIARTFDLAVLMGEIETANVSASAACIALSQRLPPGRLFAVLDDVGGIALSGKSPNSSAVLPYDHEDLDERRLNRFASNRTEVRFGPRRVVWWTYASTPVPAQSDTRPTRSILDGLFARHVASEEEIHRMRQAIGGIGGAAKSMAAAPTAEEIHLRLRRAFAKRRDFPESLLDDPEFAVWMSKRAIELASK